MKAALVGFSTIEDAGNCVAEIIAQGCIPAGMEIMDKALTCLLYTSPSPRDAHESIIPFFALKNFFLMIRRPPRSTRKESSAASDVYKRQQLRMQETVLQKLSLKDVFQQEWKLWIRP